MFTGIVEEVGRVTSAQPGNLVIAASDVLQGMELGSSIAVNGVCVTVTSFTRESFNADLSPETVEKTKFSNAGAGDVCNLERAIRAGEPFGGHFVSGHVDGTGKVMAITQRGSSMLYKISAPRKLMRYIPSKGSVAVDGISLTPFDCTDDDFTVSIIPHTSKKTTLQFLSKGDVVNIECDIIGKYIERLIRHIELDNEEGKKSKIDKKFLEDSGFLYM